MSRDRAPFKIEPFNIRVQYKNEIVLGCDTGRPPHPREFSPRTDHADGGAAVATDLTNRTIQTCGAPIAPRSRPISSQPHNSQQRPASVAAAESTAALTWRCPCGSDIHAEKACAVHPRCILIAGCRATPQRGRAARGAQRARSAARNLADGGAPRGHHRRPRRNHRRLRRHHRRRCLGSQFKF